MTSVRYTAANVREISAWANNCLAATVADYLVDQLLQDKLTDETAKVLGDLVADFYQTQVLTKQQLKSLFADKELFPIDRQVILGVLFRSLIAKRDMNSTDKFINSTDQQVDVGGFYYLASLLKIDLQFFVCDQNNRSIVAPSSVVGLENLTSASNSADAKSTSPLVVLYDYQKAGRSEAPGHFSRLVRDPSALAALDKQVNSGAFQSATAKVRDEKDNYKALKAFVSAKIAKVCRATLSSREPLPASIPKPGDHSMLAPVYGATPKTATNSATKVTKSLSAESDVDTIRAATIRSESGYASFAVAAEAIRRKTVSAGTPKSPVVSYMFSDKSETLVTVEDQLKLDRLLALELHEEELASFNRRSKK